MAPAQKGALKRLQTEYRRMQQEPVSHIEAHPLSSNILVWHFCLEGSADSDYAGGVYHGKITFPPNYPWQPPSIQMMTPSGRFETNTRLCLSMTDFHPESWNPMWSVSTILTGLMSFMYEEATSIGSMKATTSERQRLAAASYETNLKSPTFRKLFGESWEAKMKARAESAAAEPEPSTSAPHLPTEVNHPAGSRGLSAEARSLPWLLMFGAACICAWALLLL